MLNKKDFSNIRKDLVKLDNKREKTIIISRDTIKLSKLIINLIHREELDKCKSYIAKIKESVAKLDDSEGIARAAKQEYAEALTFYYIVKENKLPTRREIKIDTESYLLGVCDLTGELVRRGINLVIKNRYDDAEKIKKLVDDIYTEFLTFNLRNGELRKKFDSIKYNLKKLEEVMYDVKVKKC
ncbi:MAG: hypothetical protein PHT54_02525 [Candidatus Nanoarchaeia archaeon]|nr:hypothetical protein [Candidatus Nanoarchaeia archaeon]